MRSHDRAGDTERGAAAVELALVLFPLLMLLLGIVEFSRVYSIQLRMQQAARETAREVALHYDDPLIDVAALTALVDTTLDDLLGEDFVDSLTTRSVTLCGDPTDDAVVVLVSNEALAIPLVGGGTVGAVDVAARSRMPCEG